MIIDIMLMQSSIYRANIISISFAEGNLNEEKPSALIQCYILLCVFYYRSKTAAKHVITVAMLIYLPTLSGQFS